MRGAERTESTSPGSLLILIPGEDSRGRAGKPGEMQLNNQTDVLQPNGGLQRGIRKDLWPKYSPECPVARHFVCTKEMHVGCHC